MPNNLSLPEVDWSQQPGLLGGITRLYQHLMGMGGVGTVPTQGMVSPQDYNPVAQVAQFGQMATDPMHHKLDIAMAAAPLLVGGLAGKKLGLGEEPSGFGEFANKPNDSVPPQYEGTNKSVIWQHAENPSVQIHHWPDSKTHPYKIYEHNFDTGEDQLHYSAQTFDQAKEFANDLNGDLKSDKIWGLQHPQGWGGVGAPTPLGKKMLGQLSTPELPLQDYGLNPMSKSAAQDVPRNLNTIINSKDSTYHATGVGNAIDILKSGFIRPGSGEPLQLPGGGYSKGVSVSRVPRVASKSTRSISFVIDPKALPAKTSPIAETGYGKTKGAESLANIITENEYFTYSKLNNNKLSAEIHTGYGSPEHTEAKTALDKFESDMVDKYGAKMNKHFEFELRTPNQPITMNSVKGIIVDRSALSPDERALLPQIKQMATQRGLPYKEVANGRELHSYRAKMSKTPSGQPLYGAGAVVGAGALGAQSLYNQMFGDKNAPESR